MRRIGFALLIGLVFPGLALAHERARNAMIEEYCP